MMDQKLYIYVVFICVIGVNFTGACTFPTDLQSGTWHSSDMGNVTFNSTHFVATGVVDFGTLTFACTSNSGSQYYSLSETFNYLSNDLKVALCFNLYQQSTTKFVYFPLTGILDNTNITRILFKSDTYSFTQAETCALTTESPSQIRMLIKEDFINVSSSSCNNNILGNFMYNNFSGNGCNDTSLVACADQSTLTFNYTTCSTKMMYSADGVLSCVYYTTSGNYQYTIVYNQDSSVDESTYYRFTCIVSQIVGTDYYITTHPQACLESQNASTIDYPGLAVTLAASTTCPISSDDDDDVLSAGGAVAIALALLVIIAAVAIIGVWYYFKVHKKKKVNPDPDFIPAKSPPVDTKEQKQLDGRVSPFSPYPTVSELAVYRFGPEPGGEIDDDDGGMTLEATTPGFTEGRRTIYDKDAERESQVSLPMYSEVGGETPEPTRLSEVNTRMSEVSEANIADPTPWTMTRATMNIPEETSVSPMQSESGKAQTPREANDVTL